jgi:hypothetical protein
MARLPFPVGSVNWQDYRATNTGMIVYYSSDPVSEVPIREIPEEFDSPVAPEPHYETGTHGLYSCSRPKVRQAFMKSKVRYLLFVTKYAGTNADLRDKYLITGFYRISRTADAKRLHIRYCRDYECLELTSSCMAFLADEVHFVAAEDAVVVTEEMLKAWGYAARITKQTRIILDETQTAALLAHLRLKPNALDAYIAETERLQPHAAEGDAEEVEEDAEAEVEQPAADTTVMETQVFPVVDERVEPDTVNRASQ